MDPVAERIVKQQLASGNGGVPDPDPTPDQMMVQVQNADGTTSMLPWQIALVRFQAETLKEVVRVREALESIATAAAAFKMPFGLGKLKGVPGGNEAEG